MAKCQIKQNLLSEYKYFQSTIDSLNRNGDEHAPNGREIEDSMKMSAKENQD